MTSFLPPIKGKEQEEGSEFRPKFDANGLLTAVAQDQDTGEILMLAHMNEEALRLTLKTGKAHFYSRSRQTIWLKGETSGNVLQVHAILTDCDQDAIVMKVQITGDKAACHTGRTSCFYRSVSQDISGMIELRSKSSI